jgi:hypothetical protein
MISAPGTPELDCSRSGKWTGFVTPEDQDEVWEKIQAATEAGNLGPAARTRPEATVSSRQLQALEALVAAGALSAEVVAAIPDTSLLTCVYTYDFNDRDDVGRVLVALRELGFGGRLLYTTDTETSEGDYGDGPSIYVSQPGSVDFQDQSSVAQPGATIGDDPSRPVRGGAARTHSLGLPRNTTSLTSPNADHR